MSISCPSDAARLYREISPFVPEEQAIDMVRKRLGLSEPEARGLIFEAWKDKQLRFRAASYDDGPAYHREDLERLCERAERHRGATERPTSASSQQRQHRPSDEELNQWLKKSYAGKRTQDAIVKAAMVAFDGLTRESARKWTEGFLELRRGRPETK